MSFTMEVYNLLIRYAKDYQGKTVTMEELITRPWWKCVWGHWRAKAYYKLNNHYERLEDVPEGLDNYYIVTKTECTHYFMSGDKMRAQAMDKDTCKAIYS